MKDKGFTPALGTPRLTFLYDVAIRLLTRERRWRALFLRQVRPRPGERILDVGCGTGTFAIMMKMAEPLVEVVAMDPDGEVLQIAGRKARQAGVHVDFVQGYAREADRLGQAFDKAVASLVFHQVPIEEKEQGIAAMFRAVSPGGQVHIADYARQRSVMMRLLFRIVQALDGYENTQANADGALERILTEHADLPIAYRAEIATLTGAVSLFRADIRRD